MVMRGNLVWGCVCVVVVCACVQRAFAFLCVCICVSNLCVVDAYRMHIVITRICTYAYTSESDAAFRKTPLISSLRWGVVFLVLWAQGGRPEAYSIELENFVLP